LRSRQRLKEHFVATFTGSNGAELFPDLMNGPIQAIGNDFVDALAGDDIAIGWSGDDVIRGGAGADVIIGGLLNSSGVITASGIDAADYTTSIDGVTIDLSVTVSLILPMLGVNLQLTNAAMGFGGDAQNDFLQDITSLIGSNTGSDTLTGSAGANTLNGQGGNDILTGLGGSDILLGGAGDDVLVGGAGADSLQGGAGISDTADYSASASPVIVNLTSGTGSGGDAQGDTLTGIERVIGSAGNDSLNGSAGDEVLIGGAGADALTGGGGVDTADYSGSAAAVIVNLAAGTGSGGDAQGDTLSGTENAIGSAFADRLTGTGAGTLDGGAGNDVLNGAATLNGGAGNDTLLGGAAVETLNGGADDDTVSYAASSAGVTVDLGLPGPQVSSGDASGDTLSGIENLRGSLFSDTLIGNDGANILHDGGTGPLPNDGVPDTLIGNGGNDTYIVYAAAALIVEIAGEGHDRLAAGVDFVLAAGVSVEYLNTTSLTATSAIDLTGNDIRQWVRGNNGDNVLDGGGGIDTLFGMGGADAFRFSTALGAGNVDRIADFSVADDSIHLDDAIFTALTTLGTLDASAFKDIALAARDADDRILYNSTTGSLFYDADGSASAFAPVKFAALSPGLALSAANFVVV
jgi:Ca2+-binding RTX toxin-like protein